MTRFPIACFVACALAALPGFGQPSRATSARRTAPVRVTPVRGRYCSAYAPQGWFVVAENAQRVAFGADLQSGDGKLGASYAVFSAGTLNIVPGNETPDRAVANSITMSGTQPARFGTRKQLGPTEYLIEFQNAGTHGYAFYQVFPAGRGGYMIVLREAVTAIPLWNQRASESSAVARSLHCQVPNVPPSPDPPSLTKHERRTGSATGGEDDSQYNPWLDKEYYHDPRTGENYWVSPSQDYSNNGPDGPGYYVPSGNATVKLDPGYR